MIKEIDHNGRSFERALHTVVVSDIFQPDGFGVILQIEIERLPINRITFLINFLISS